MTQEILIRRADAQDISALAQLHVEGGRDSYAGLVDQAYLDGLSVKDFEKNWHAWMKEGIQTDIAEIDSVMCGFCSYGPLKTPPPGSSPIRPQYSSEIYAIYVLSDYWRRGVGSSLLQRAAQQLRNMKHNSLCLWVLKGNDRAGAFYEKHGGQRVGKHDIAVGPSNVKEVCYAWRDIEPLL